MHQVVKIKFSSNYFALIFKKSFIHLCLFNIYLVQMVDSGVTFTNDDATSCKRYAVHKHYWKDDYLQYFIRGIPEKKTPEINRGYFIRHRLIREIINQFLDLTNRECQIVILGAGFETLYWNLFEHQKHPKFGIYEIDLTPVVQRKSFFINSKSQLKNCLAGNVIINKESITSDFYKLSIADISRIDAIDEALSKNKIDKSIPTLFLAECVMVYLKMQHIEEMMKYITDNYKMVIYLEYDPINLNDRFGEVMKENLHRRQSDLFGVHTDIESKKTFLSRYFKNVDCQLLCNIYKRLPKKELDAMEKLEFLDEVHLLSDLLKHYALSVCSNDDFNLNLSSIKI